jgi:hypothetical protein
MRLLDEMEMEGDDALHDVCHDLLTNSITHLTTITNIAKTK